MALCSNRGRLLCMLSLTFGFFIVEVVVSRVTASLAMLSDSFHMLSDVIALLVALVAMRFSEITQASSKNTFGWVRAEVIGALVNAVFLSALCFTILLEAIQRCTAPHEIENPQVVIWVGLVGLLVNMLGLCLFHSGHGHSHHGHSKKSDNGHSENSSISAHEPSPEEEAYNLIVNSQREEQQTAQVESDILRKDGLDVHINGVSLEASDQNQETASQLNMKGVFLHILGDALGSVIVVVNALIFNFVWKPCKDDGYPCVNPCYHGHCTGQHLSDQNSTTVSLAGPCWVLYLDPTLCVIMVAILLYTTFPLIRESALILLQTVPKQIDMHKLNGKLRSMEGVLSVHELHIWQLAGSRIIATAHIKCLDPSSYMDIAKRIKGFFHDEGIHATTIQPEFAANCSEPNILGCELSCRIQCAPKLCCDASSTSVQRRVGVKSSVVASNCNAPNYGDNLNVSIRQSLRSIVQTEMESTV